MSTFSTPYYSHIYPFYYRYTLCRPLCCHRSAPQSTRYSFAFLVLTRTVSTSGPDTVVLLVVYRRLREKHKQVYQQLVSGRVELREKAARMHETEFKERKE